ncbi:MAG: 3',5'-cyclic-AMP phosphodiesterase [Gammaproteobacteria bacterium]|nr:3',5'-cyclic-AMP phosphodiesterase [Gammaproteobacteria bacterium]
MTVAKDRKALPAKLLSKLPAGSLRVLQISDTHLYADATERLAGLNTDQSLLQLLQHARNNILPVDLVLVTGDLVHDATASGYQRLRDHLLTLDAQTYCIPGNHDLNPVLADNINCNRISTDTLHKHENWAMIMLDSTIPGKVKGHLNNEQLGRLKSALDDHPEYNILISLHHQPVPLGSAWIDKLALDNPDDLFSILDQHNNVRGVLWGHAHQPYDGERNGVKLMGSPSTCIQFKPGQDEFGIHQSPPGLRWLALLPDGRIETDIEYRSNTPTELDLASTGY